MRDERARVPFVLELPEQWHVQVIEVPDYLATLRQPDLIALRDAGVDLSRRRAAGATPPWRLAVRDAERRRSPRYERT